MKRYACIFFDLDHTLWDFEKNSEETLNFLFHQYDLTAHGISGFSYFHETFVRVNTGLWEQHDKGQIGSDFIRTQRFHEVFTAAGLDNYPLSIQLSAEYLLELPKKKSLIPHAIETLDYLHTKYPLAIITNGFDDIQLTKLKSAGISHYFKNIVTSQRARSKKPSREIFDFALTESGHPNESAIMIGDNLLTDIEGATSAGIDAVYFNPAKTVHDRKIPFEINSLRELQNLL